jgi:predicted nucleotidyltransferase component of viral defense system
MSKRQNHLENFLKYSPEYQNEILVACADKLDKPALILEKDIWVCLTLDKLFSMPNALNMVFKGGTSLSKAFNVIDRFSEDVDVTIDYRNFTDKDPLSPSLSRTQRDKLSDLLKASMKDHIKNTILPYLEDSIKE